MFRGKTRIYRDVSRKERGGSAQKRKAGEEEVYKGMQIDIVLRKEERGDGREWVETREKGERRGRRRGSEDIRGEG